MSHKARPDEARPDEARPDAPAVETHPPESLSNGQESQFEMLADQSDPGIVREFVDFLRYNKKWWLTPIVVISLVLVGLAFLAPSPVAPFIYALF